MAKGEFHLGPEGPGPCNADPANPKSKGCPFQSTDHFSTEAEAYQKFEEAMENAGYGIGSSLSKEDIEKVFLKTHFDRLVADPSYGIVKHEKYGWVADGSQGLRSFIDTYFGDTDGYDIDYDTEPNTDGEVIRSIYIEELDIEIENQNLDEDMREYFEAVSDARYEGAMYRRG